jgi:hypothetical protein
LSNPFAYINIYRAGGEDSQFAQLGNASHTNLATSDCSPFTTFSKAFDPLFPGVSQSLESRYTQTETTGTVADCMKRPSSFTPDSLYVPLRWTLGAGNSNYLREAGEPFNYFASVFVFWRGGLNFGRSPDPAIYQTTTLKSTRVIPTLGDGIFFNYELDPYAGPAQFTTVTVPYFSNVPYFPTFTYGYSYAPEIIADARNSYRPTSIISTWGIGDNRTHISSADDNLFMFPVPLFPYFFGPADFSGGFAPIAPP